MDSSSIGCGGQNSLEAASQQPNSPPGERINDDENTARHFKDTKH